MMGVAIVSVEPLCPAPTLVLLVGTLPLESLPSVCLESRPLELLSALESRSGPGCGGGAGDELSDRIDGIIPRGSCGDIGREALGEVDALAPGIADDLRGGGVKAAEDNDAPPTTGSCPLPSPT